MKKIILVSFLFFVVLFAGGLVYLAPYHYYITAIKEGLESELLTVKRAPAKYLKGESYKVDRGEDYYRDDDTRWKNFHFSHFLLPVPIYHPVYYLRPEIDYDEIDDTSEFGFSLINSQSEVFAKVMLREPFFFHFELGKDKLFNLPYFKNYILNVPPEKVWRDLFIKDLLVTSQEGDELYNFYQSYKLIEHLSIQDLAYRLFILRNRKRLFNDEFDALNFYEDGQMGVLRTHQLSKNDQYDRDILFVFRRGVVYPLEIQTLRFSPEAELYRQRIFEALEFKETSEDASIPIYSQYRQLDYQSRLAHEGMIYLYMAWSHVPQKREFIREMIRFVERSDQREMFIIPLYEYAYQKFGTTFSQAGNLREKAQQRLERKAQEEFEKELQREAQRSLDIPEGQFESVDQRMDFFLQRAQEEGFDTSIENNMLIRD